MISSMSVIAPGAQLGTGVTVGDFTVIHGNVQIGDQCSIGSHCVIGEPTRLAEGKPLVLEAGAKIRSHCVLYEGSTLGPRLETGHHVTIRELTTSGINLRVGSYTDLQGNQSYGHYCRLHSDVHIGKGLTAGNFVWIFPRCMTTNDPLPPSHNMVETIMEDLVVVCSQTLMLPGVRLGLGAFVGAGSFVRKSVPAVTCVSGSPAEPFGLLHQLVNMEYRIRAPWPLHFADAYPEEAQPLLAEVLGRVQAALSEARRKPRHSS